MKLKQRETKQNETNHNKAKTHAWPSVNKLIEPRRRFRTLQIPHFSEVRRANIKKVKMPLLEESRQTSQDLCESWDACLDSSKSGVSFFFSFSSSVRPSVRSSVRPSSVRVRRSARSIRQNLPRGSIICHAHVYVRMGA